MLVAMLRRMATCLGYHFDPVELRRGVYRPMGHVNVEADQLEVLHGAASVLKGEKALPMEVRGWPVDPNIVAAQQDLWAHLLAWLRGETAPRVRLEGTRTE